MIFFFFFLSPHLLNPNEQANRPHLQTHEDSETDAITRASDVVGAEENSTSGNVAVDIESDRGGLSGISVKTLLVGVVLADIRGASPLDDETSEALRGGSPAAVDDGASGRVDGADAGDVGDAERRIEFGIGGIGRERDGSRRERLEAVRLDAAHDEVVRGGRQQIGDAARSLARRDGVDGAGGAARLHERDDVGGEGGVRGILP